MTTDRKDRRLFRIGEVSRLTGVNPHVLRYWERELPQLAPNRSLSKQRYYRLTDIERIRLVKHLLTEERYTLDGVRKVLATQPMPGPAPKGGQEPDPEADSYRRLLQEVVMALKEIRDILT